MNYNFVRRLTSSIFASLMNGKSRIEIGYIGLPITSTENKQYPSAKKSPTKISHSNPVIETENVSYSAKDLQPRNNSSQN